MKEWTDYTTEFVTLMLPGFCWFDICSCFLGAIHCMAWNFHFPTPIERFLWRISSLAIIALPLVFSISLLFSVFSIKFRGEFQLAAHKPTNKIWLVWLLLQFIAYFAARIFLLAELFLSMRELPIDAYTDISWSNFVPHI